MIGGGAERVISILSSFFSAEKENKVYVLVTSSGSRDTYHVSSDVILLFASDFQANSCFRKIKLIVSLIHDRNIQCLIPFSPSSCGLCSIAKIRTKVPMICSERNSPEDYPTSKKLRFIRLLSYHLADFVVFQSGGARDYFGKSIRKKAVIIPNPVSAVPVNNSSMEKIILFVGRLENQKNPEFALKSFDFFWMKHKEYTLVLLGTGSKMDSLKSMVSNLSSCGHIKLLGFSNDPDRYFKTASVFIMTSRFEGMPNALLEASAYGVPCVALDCRPGGCRDLIVDGRTGFLLPEVSDPQSFSTALSKVVDGLPFYKTQAQAFAKAVQEKYSLNAVCLSWESLLAKSIQRELMNL